MRKAIVLAAVLAVLAVVVHWRMPELMQVLPWNQATTPAERAAEQAEAKAEAESSTQSAEAQPQGQPPAEVVENPDAETGLQKIIPRASVGHAQNLHKTPSTIPLGSSAVVVMDASSRKVLLAKNEEAVLPMASITKLMTAMVVLEGKQPLDQPLTITEDDIDKVRMSRSRLRAGSVLPRAEAMQLALMSSENRAAHALGRTYPGGLPAFVAAMNRKAQQLGMKNTVYVDPTGLSENNKSTARDLATLVLAASEYPLIRDYSTQKEHRAEFGGRALLYRNSNALARDASWDLVLQKTGYIIEAGHSVAMRAKVDDRDLVMVILDAGDNRSRNTDARRIRNWVAPGFEEAWAKAHPPAPKVVAKAKDKSEKKPAKGKGKDGDKVDKTDKADKGEKTAKSSKPEKETGSSKEARVSKSFKGKDEDESPKKTAKAKKDSEG